MNIKDPKNHENGHDYRKTMCNNTPNYCHSSSVESPVVFTTDIELIKKVFTTHFGSFPTRNPQSGSIGAGPIFGNTLDIMADMPRWKRMRSTVL